MFRIMCKAKIHGAVVTETKLDYEGSITIDEELMQEADILPSERVEVLNLNNGARFSTYTITGEPGSGKICINGAAARLAEIGDRLIILSYGVFSDEEAKNLKKKIVFVNESNRMVEKREG